MTSTELNSAITSALARIPPLWPLRHFVAVNPFVGLIDRPFPAAAELLQRVCGAAPLQSASSYLEAYRKGEIQQADLEDAADRGWTAAGLVQELLQAAAVRPSEMLQTVADLVDGLRVRSHWSSFIVDEISKWCAVTFDENQTTWTTPWRNEGLYRAWRDAAKMDRNPEAFGLTDFRSFVCELPEDPIEAIAACVATLERSGPHLTDFLHRQLASISGWAGYVQYRVREDALRGRTNTLLSELLAIRLAYDTALFHALSDDAKVVAAWRESHPTPQGSRRLAALARWQYAYETGYQKRLARDLKQQPALPQPGRPEVQAIFCIDVRSEVFRRHLEQTRQGIQTIGFAGFFGFPVSHSAGVGCSPAARCPVLLVPPVDTCVPLSADARTHEQAKLATAGAWKAFQNSAASCFSFVESVGLGFGAALGRPRSAGRLNATQAMPAFTETSLDTRVSLAAGALVNMSLTENFARLVLISGHGSESANNPYASGLDCGACGGHAGDVNARLAAATLNDPAVRARLARQGLAIPTDTVFLAGLHNTTTDDLILFDLEQVPDSHKEDVARLREALGRAGAATRRERAPSLGLLGHSEEHLDSAIRARAHDIAQVRPEWGLANNAALIAAPRSRTRGLNLNGRVFLHDYLAASDPEDKVLNLILCAPVVVASWINLQYYASRVDPVRYGAGNKVLHNVVGGLGVVEGNGGDLKVGLPLQSIHNGKDFTHEPRRLSVYIEADPKRITAVLEKNPSVRQLFDHEWLHLFSLQGSECFRYRAGDWLNV